MSVERRRLRLWPGAAAVGLLLVFRFVVPAVFPGALLVGLLGAAVGVLTVVVWWLFFSRASWGDRLAVLGVTVLAIWATPLVLHESVATGQMGMTFPVYVLPVLCLAWVLGAAASRRLAVGPWRVTMIAAVLIACGVFALLRHDGVSGDGAVDFSWRWSTAPEDRLRAASIGAPTSSASAAEAVEADWPGYRGPGRDGVLHGVRIDADWDASPPVELWRRPVGPGWSSFAVGGGLVFTQEQRGDEEFVTSYELASGRPVWSHGDAARFWEPEGSVGPRATPTLSGGRLYSLGATGILNVFDPADGSVVWSHSLSPDVEVPHYGFASSPLVLDDVVIVYSDRLVAHDLATGEPRWSGPAGGETYSSPQLLAIDGAPQVVQANVDGVAAVAPDGAPLWEHEWRVTKIVQPALTVDGDLLVGTWGGDGTRSLGVKRGATGWGVEERWTSNRLKPDFSGFVVHEGHAYGFDGRILACIDLAEGQRKWKGGRYGHGQLLLLADQDLLLLVTEKGELALVSATPDGFNEIARVPAIEGKTWNQPVLVDDILLVRNTQEMAAFRVALAGG